MPDTAREFRLASRPDGEPVEADFELAEGPVPEPADGQVLVRNSYLSVDPYMRGRMRDIETYVPPYALGETLEGGALGQVVASRSDALAEGTWVVSAVRGWRDHYVAAGDDPDLQRLDPRQRPAQTALGILGLTGFTAWAGLIDVGQPREGETLFVSGAAGAVGSVVGQIGKARGLRVIGSAGSADKVEWLTGELGFDAAFDYHGDVDAALAEHAPDGVDVFFDNVGGTQLEAALGQMNNAGRIAICGSISNYNDRGERRGPARFDEVLFRRLTVRGFIILDHYARFGAFLDEMAPLVESGQLVNRETIVDGIERMPAAFIGLLEGQNTGKMLVRVGPEPD